MKEVLVVEDDPVDVLLLREALKGRDGVLVSVAEHGVEALRRLRKATEKPPSLVLLDWRLPRMDGAEVLAAIKGDPALKCLPVVVFSGSEAEGDVRRAYELGANCYFVKPKGLDQFKRLVLALAEHWLDLARLPEATPAGNALPKAG